MKTINILLTLLTFFIGYGSSNAQTSVASTEAVQIRAKLKISVPEGTFSGNLDDKQYNVSIECSYFNEDYFKFQSDNTGATDSNGDGLIISGFQKDQKLVLTIIDNGKTFSAANIQFTKGNNTASGGGRLFEENTTKSFKVSFKVECQ